MRVPFDSLCVAAVVDELKPYVGARVQRAYQWDPYTIGLGLYKQREAWLLVSCDARYARMHLMARRLESPKEPPPFCMALRKHLMEARLEFVRQRGLDRVVDIGFSSSTGDLQLVVELMGKHSNIVLVGPDRRVLAAAKVVSASKSRRPIVPGKEYLPPPFEPRPSLLEARAGDDLRKFEGASPFLQRLIEAGLALELVQKSVTDSAWSPSFADGFGAYPLPLTGLFPNAVPRESVSVAIEQAYAAFADADRLESARTSLLAQLRRVLDARNVALIGIDEALDAAARAREMQEKGELVLAFQREIPSGAALFTTTGYDGAEVTIKLDPLKTPVENAQRFFSKARRAKEGATVVAGQKVRLSEDRAMIERSIDALAAAQTYLDVDRVREEADKRKWLHHQVVARTKEERPFEGHSIRELVSPAGWKVLYGENATSNDYLTTKVARPNDYWFHVRGVTSAHVVLQTQNQPERVQREDLVFAAKVAVSKSTSKHSSYVAVDYTLKKHVRKPKKSPPGFVTYAQEKVLHVDL